MDGWGTVDDFRHFHYIDRQIFSRLFINLGRDPYQSMKVIALWIWMELQMVFPNMVRKLLEVPDSVLNDAAEEAESCIVYIEQSQRGQTSHLPVTSRLSSRTVLLCLFDYCQTEALIQIRETVHGRFLRVFEDILQLHTAVRHMINELSTTSQVSTVSLLKRTVIAKFSREKNVSEEDLRSFFIWNFADFALKIQMEDLGDSEYLYALVLLQHISTITQVLGREWDKSVQINGKYVELQKFFIEAAQEN